MFHRHAREWKLRPLLFAALLAWVLAIPASQNPNPAVATRPGEWRTLTLEDGTVAILGPRTALTYSYTHQRRSIYLSGGEALFRVKKEPARPFIVGTPVGCARALGTIFSVSHHRHSTSVTTQEGIVAAARRNPDDPSCSRDSIRLLAGQKAIIENWLPLVARDVDTAIEHAWTTREIIFIGQTVEQALGEFNRRNWIQLDMPDAVEIRHMRLFGRFPLDDPERFARYLKKQQQHWRRRPR